MPTRPSGGGPIATDWGQDVHDRIFDPEGDRITSVTNITISTTNVKLDLGDGVPGSPGGWLDQANDRAVCPAGKGGVYYVVATVRAISIPLDNACRANVFKNGVSLDEMHCSIVGIGSGNAAYNHMCAWLQMAAGDYLEVWANSTSAAGSQQARVNFLKLLRVGDVGP
jgi:hypothetical protein